MIKNLIRYEKILEILFFLSLTLVFLDSYEFMEFPLTWFGNFLMVGICIFIYIKEKMRANSLLLLIIFTTLLPTIFNLFSFDLLFSEIIYTITRVASYLGFIITFFVISKSQFKDIIFKNLVNVFYLVIALSIYTYFAQLFNFYEPYRNRPGTGILGFDIQTNFWITDSHRMIGTFREPVFLVSILFPSFLVIHYKSINTTFFYFISAVLFGLTKSELSIILLVTFLFFEIILMKKLNRKVIIFVFVFLSCFFIPINECDISPQNYECPQSNDIETTNDSGDEDLEYQLSSPEDFEFQNRERLDSFQFFIDFLSENSGYGFQSTNKIYTNYLASEVNHEMYLTNRTLPKYLNVRYLSESFGTGRYFLTYENINLQNNFMFNLYSIGMVYVILLFCIILFSLHINFKNGIKIMFILFSIAIASIEDLLPVYGLYLSLLFTMEQNEDK
tara:strand:- start:1981 stop:3318 length:1338 start_codon:yes stop_codon:yes gene_type:complete